MIQISFLREKPRCVSKALRRTDVATVRSKGDRNALWMSDEERLNGFRNLVLGHWLVERTLRA
jgi:hypothetical protein